MALNFKSCCRKIIVITALCFAAAAPAQESFEEWKKAQQEDYEKFKIRQMAEFSEFLKQEWQEFQLFKERNAYDAPKPEIIPAATPREIPPESLASAPVIDRLQTLEQPEVTADSIFSIFSSGEPLTFAFFGAEVTLTVDKDLKNIELPEPLNNESIRQFGEAIGATDFVDLLEQTQSMKTQMELNDWGYYLFLSEIAKNIHPVSVNKQRLLIWYLLIASGYEARVGYHQTSVHLLLPLTPAIYGARYLRMNGKSFYLLASGDDQQSTAAIHTYPETFQGAENDIILTVINLPRFSQETENRPVSFNYGGETYQLHLKTRRNVIDFYRDYPQTDYSVYFRASLSPEAHNSLLNGLRPIIEGRPETEAANILLRFVQTAFAYATDDKQFGREKPLFAEETLYYPYSDCEDRSVLFTYLVRNLLGLDVIALDYPGHLATAVKFSTDVGGDTIEYNGQTYTVCDPTYTNAGIGQSMPEYKDAELTVIAMNEVK